MSRAGEESRICNASGEELISGSYKPDELSGWVRAATLAETNVQSAVESESEKCISLAANTRPFNVTSALMAKFHRLNL